MKTKKSKKEEAVCCDEDQGLCEPCEYGDLLEQTGNKKQ